MHKDMDDPLSSSELVPRWSISRVQLNFARSSLAPLLRGPGRRLPRDSAAGSPADSYLRHGGIYL